MPTLLDGRGARAEQGLACGNLGRACEGKGPGIRQRDRLLVCAVCQAVASGIHLASLIFSLLILKQIRMPTPTGRDTRPGEGDSPVGVTSLFACPVPAPALTPCRPWPRCPHPGASDASSHMASALEGKAQMPMCCFINQAAPISRRWAPECGLCPPAS